MEYVVVLKDSSDMEIDVTSCHSDIIISSRVDTRYGRRDLLIRATRPGFDENVTYRFEPLVLPAVASP